MNSASTAALHAYANRRGHLWNVSHGLESFSLHKGFFFLLLSFFHFFHFFLNQWINCFQALPLEVAARLWDVFLFEGTVVPSWTNLELFSNVLSTLYFRRSVCHESSSRDSSYVRHGVRVLVLLDRNWLPALIYHCYAFVLPACVLRAWRTSCLSSSTFLRALTQICCFSILIRFFLRPPSIPQFHSSCL